MKRIIVLLILFVLTQIGHPAIAASDPAIDIYLDDIPIVDGEYLLASWKVIARSGLNCRFAPGINNTIVTRFNYGSPITAKVSEGRTSNVNPIKLDPLNLPWMKINYDRSRSSDGTKICFVRSTRRFIAPVL